MWTRKFQIAIIEKNTDELENLLSSMPEFDSVQEMESVMYLLREAAELVYTLKDETALAMSQIKKNINFLKSTQAPRTNKLDIKS